VDFDENLKVTSQPDTSLLAMDDALNRLALVYARKSRVLEFRFFGGLSVKDTAEVIKVSADTVCATGRGLLRERAYVSEGQIQLRSPPATYESPSGA
jgi:ECF sigma factor